MCEDCKFFIYDNSTGQADCKQCENMTEKELEKYYTNEETGCPYKINMKLAKGGVEI